MTIQSIRADNTKQGYQIIVYSNYHSYKPQVQVFMVDINKESRWRVCIKAGLESMHKAQVKI